MDYFSRCYPCEFYQIKSHLNVTKCSTNRQHYDKGLENLVEIVKFNVSLWSHHHYKQSEWWPLLGISILYLVEICLLVPSRRGKGGDRKPRSHVWFCDHTLITITYDYWGKQNVKEVWVTWILPHSNYFFPLISRCIPILNLLISAFWAFDSHGTSNGMEDT